MAHPLIGRLIPFGPVEVTPASITAFSRGINAAGGKYADPAHAEFAAHPMYCATSVIPSSGLVLFQPEGNFNVNRIVHGGIDIHFGESVKPGNVLSTQSTLLGIDEKSSGNVLRIGFTTRKENGGVVARGETRYFIRGKKSEGGKVDTTEMPIAGEKAEPVAEMAVPTGKDQSLLYAEGSGDRFFIHTDDVFAQSVGLPGMIMHGMCTLALSAGAVVDAVAGGDPRAMRSLSCKFSQIVLPGETLRVAISRAGPNRYGFETWNAAGQRAITEGAVKC